MVRNTMLKNTVSSHSNAWPIYKPFNRTTSITIWSIYCSCRRITVGRELDALIGGGRGNPCNFGKATVYKGQCTCCTWFVNASMTALHVLYHLACFKRPLTKTLAVTTRVDLLMLFMFGIIIIFLTKPLPCSFCDLHNSVRTT